MILSPDEQQSLQVIDRALAAAEPHLAGMLGIFTRLHADEANPPAEDLVIPWLDPSAGRGGPAGRAGGARARRRRRGVGRRQGLDRGQGLDRSQGLGRGNGPGRGRDGGARGVMQRPADGLAAGVDGKGGVRGSAGVFAFFAVPALLLTTLVLVVVFGLGSSIRCRTVPASAAHGTTAVAVPAGSGFAACPASPGKAASVAKTTGTGTGTGAGH